MSYNTRRGAGNFNKGIPSSQVGQRRSQGPSNYGQNPPSKNYGNQQNANYGHIAQDNSRQQQSRQPTAQQQLAKQQQMLVQKKQQEAQQQKQAQQKQQEEMELRKKKELELQRQKELEQQKQKELELQKQKELELQKQKDLELQKQKELELQKQKELEIQKQKELELQKAKEQELQRLKEIELEQLKKLEMKNFINNQEMKKEEQSKELVSDTMEVEQQQGDTISEDVPEPPKLTGDDLQTVGNKPLKHRFPRARKLTKYEIQRRRNQRLSKLLQPKSAMVILNEVSKNLTYNVEKCQGRTTAAKGFMFKATVVIDGISHEGFGMNKAAAKNEAAEKALKFLVKSKKLVQTTSNDSTPPQEQEEPMDTEEKEKTNPADIPLAWQQFASFAIFKLLDSWGEDLEVIKDEVKVEKKPAKKLPPNPELINPLMLMNQMMPRVEFVEMPRTTEGAVNMFNFQAVVDGKTFRGTGACKKVAKRLAAFAICNEVLGITYPPEIYTPPSNRVETISIAN